MGLLNVGIQDAYNGTIDSASGNLVNPSPRFARSHDQPTGSHEAPPPESPPAVVDDLSMLIVLAGRGDRSAFRTLYDRSAARLLGAAMRILGNRELAEDVVQDAYVRIWRSAATFDPARGHALPWMGRIIRNLCFDTLAKMRTADAIERDLSRVEDIDMATLPVDPPDARLQACLDQLSENQRRAVLLIYIHGMTHSELSAHLGVPLGTVKSWVTRGAHMLRSRLGGANGQQG